MRALPPTGFSLPRPLEPHEQPHEKEEQRRPGEQRPQEDPPPGPPPEGRLFQGGGILQIPGCGLPDLPFRLRVAVGRGEPPAGARRAEEEIDRLWETGALDEQKVENFRNLHERTPYN